MLMRPPNHPNHIWLASLKLIHKPLAQLAYPLQGMGLSQLLWPYSAAPPELKPRWMPVGTSENGTNAEKGSALRSVLFVCSGSSESASNPNIYGEVVDQLRAPDRG